jgi:hypothetical protein
MTKPARRACYLLPAAVALAVIAVPCAAFASSTGAYLSWSHKAQSPAQPAAQPTVQSPGEAPAQTGQVHTASGAYPVPPSPYGQVGDPYARSLRWPAKQTPAVASISPSPQPELAPVPAPPVRNPAPVSLSQPVPMSAPQPPAVVPLPLSQSASAPEREDPGLADDPGMAEDAPVATIAPLTAPQAVPQAAPKPAAPPPAVASTLNTDSAYQVPATSKYAARIAAARDAARDATRAAALPAAEAPGTDARPTATAPEPDVSLASQEADHIFIPGEHYLTPADEPRFYSLHRQYGIRPDPITVTPGATGALLTVSPEEGGDPNDDDKKSDTDKN